MMYGSADFYNRASRWVACALFMAFALVFAAGAVFGVWVGWLLWGFRDLVS